MKAFVPCTLRHTALTNLGEKAGGDVLVLARIAGHSSIAVTQRYIHPQAKAINRVLTAMSQLQAGTKLGTAKTANTKVKRSSQNEAAQLPEDKGKTGARGGSRTHMRKNPRRILSPQRLPFRHPGNWHYKLNECKDLLQHHRLSSWLLNRTGVSSGVSGGYCWCVQSFDSGERMLHLEAMEWLREQLANGPVAQRKIKTDAAREGFSWATLRRAKDVLGIVTGKNGYQGPSQWSLNSKGAQSVTPHVSTFEQGAENTKLNRSGAAKDAQQWM